ncbi:ATP-dependent DNA helicase [Mycolicibacterium sp. F2034L]|uniref:ATP-dependent helicase n=1 Tax=Mycolicibacterium sp. F2034L TaxID=2926422 RepID=UPI001FF3ED03|nr:ATP-dependent DNA helicase [Mycolicibacterium sp. F2034L]MCK0174656.1 ATP-dependent helicase [Mycolicibacterium sp. F2034L]
MTASDVDTAPRPMLDPGSRGLVRLVGGPGTGKSTLLTGTAAAHIRAGVDPESVLLLTGSAQLGAQARAAITRELLRDGVRRVVRQPLVRTVHSYAFAVLRLAAQRNGGAPPRLITGAEQDGIIRELLAGDLEDGDRSAVAWPEALRPALSTAGFAGELRDLMARCTERGVDPAALQRLGRRCGRPEWSAAGRFAQAYEQIMLLRAAVGMAAPQATVPALGAAELVGAALEAFAADPDLLAAERARVGLLLVDDAQHLDPQAAHLVRVLMPGADLTVIAGDPDEAVFGYRGADPALLREPSDSPVITLTRSYRCATAVADAISGVAQRLPGAAAPTLAGVPDRAGSVTVRLAASTHAESALVADALRRAHLIDGVPWSEMAVVVRSMARVGAPLARALTAAGVPVDLPAAAAPLAEQPAVAALLTVLEAASDGLTGAQAESLLAGPLGRVDPVSMRQLRRVLRRADGSRPPRDFADLLVDALTGEPPVLPTALQRPLRRIRAVLSAAERSAAAGLDPRNTLWQAWHRSGLQRRWLAAAERGGPAGIQADRDLDAVTELFDVAEQFVTRTPAGSLRAFIDHVSALGLPPRSPAEQSTADAVTVQSAHRALGGEWEFVVIAGLQEGLWPNTAPRGGVLNTQRLVDVLDGVITDEDRGVSSRAPLLAEERRLLVAALGRARTHVLVTAVDSDAGDEAMLPSPFCAELAELARERPGGSRPTDEIAPVRAPRVLAPAALVGRLRSVVCAPDGTVDDAARDCAAAQLARLARAGVPGADPRHWQPLTPLSTEEALWSDGQDVVTLSPSTLQTLTDCPLRWLLERHGGSDSRDVRSAVGSLLHALVAESGLTETRLLNDLRRIWSQLPYEAAWHADNELGRHEAMLTAFAQWRGQTRGELTEVGTEIDVDGLVSEAADGVPAVRLRGRLDRLERDAQGRLVVVDIKTGKTPVTKDDAQQHAQLAMYQLAVAAGLLPDGDVPGGGKLVYLGRSTATGPAEREQDPMGAEALDAWRAQVGWAAAATQGPRFTARVNEGCAHCPVRSSCPAQTAGERP